MDEQGSTDEGRLQLSQSIWMFKDRKISDHGEVYEGEILSETYRRRSIIVKLVEDTEENADEAKLLLELDPHSHVVSIIQWGVFDKGPERYLYIAMDKCHEENLRKFIDKRKHDPFKESCAFDFTRQIIEGIQYIHSRKIIHRDLKPDNVFLSNDQKVIKIGDFGLGERVKSITDTIPATKGLGTVGYRAPETFHKANLTSVKTDIYSLAIVFAFIWSNGEHPFGDDMDIMDYKIKTNQDIDISILKVSNLPEAKHLLSMMLRFLPRYRPTIDEVSSHPAITGGKIDPSLDF